MGIASVHAFTLHAIPAVAHPQAFPAPSVVALQRANVAKLYDVQAAATAHALPLYAHEAEYAVQIAAEGVGTVSVHYLILQVVPPVTQPQALPEPSFI